MDRGVIVKILAVVALIFAILVVSTTSWFGLSPLKEAGVFGILLSVALLIA